MKYLILLALGVAALGVGAFIFVHVLLLAARIVAGTAGAAVGTAAGLVNLLGRKGRRVRPVIPEQLETLAANTADPELQALRQYDPQPASVPVARPVTFDGSRYAALNVKSETSSTAFLEEVDQLLSDVPAVPPYQPLFAIINQSPSYPVPAPEEPTDPPPPPHWSKRTVDVAVPTIALPYYSGSFSFLNKCVDAAYAPQVKMVSDARQLLATLEASAAARNTQIATLAGQAAKKWEHAKVTQRQRFDTAMREYQGPKTAYVATFTAMRAQMHKLYTAVHEGGSAGLLARVDLALRTVDLPKFVSRECTTSFDEQSGVLVHEHRFPDLAKLSWLKPVERKKGTAFVAANQKEQKQANEKLWPSLSLRLAVQIAALDTEGLVKGIAINGWADYTDRATGQEKRAYCSSLFATKEQIVGLRLSSLDPIVAFRGLKGIAASHVLELTPIAPIIRLDTNDPRFVDPKEVLNKMAAGENLAAMDWEDFEHLCRELFERAFGGEGTEVKVTQASRDQGVDAVIFDPDPLRGGKIVVQAKRYTNTVDVSAVRDLYGSVMNEGAIKGILVTTSQYGPDAYAFAKDKPLTLLNGRELLGLLEKHGYKFRINLAEARRRTGLN